MKQKRTVDVNIIIYPFDMKRVPSINNYYKLEVQKTR